MNGGVWCWGDGSRGQLGVRGTSAAVTPQEVTDLTSGVTQITAGVAHTCAVVEGGAWCWGVGGLGQLGHNEAGNERGNKSQPTQVMGLTSGVTQISAGNRHTCAVVNGGAWCWGFVSNGRLGNGSTGFGNASTPQKVIDLTSGVTQISAGGAHTCAVVEGGAWCWGAGLGGQLGHNEPDSENKPQPIQVMGLTSGVTQISAGANHTCAVVGGAAKCWGTGGSGQLGHNEGDGTANKFAPTQVVGLTSGVTQISAGANHTCAVVGGAAKCWGAGGSGQLGHNEGDGTADKFAPTQVVGLTSGVTQITAGGAHTCALVNGQALCWGGGHLWSTGE